MTEKNDYENILKLLPEPDVYQMPPDMTERQMMELWPRLTIRDRFTWVARTQVNLYRWATICKPYLTEQEKDPPETALSAVLRPSKNKYGIAMVALSKTLSKFRPGEVPIEEGEDMITTFKGLVEILGEIKRTKELIAADEAFERFVNVWNYKSRARVQQADFVDKLSRTVHQYLDTLTGVWTGIFDLECRIEGNATCTQLTLDDIRHETDEIYSNYEKIKRHLQGTGSLIVSKIETSKSEIIGHLPPNQSPEQIKNAMVERARYLIGKFPNQSIRQICQRVVEEYEGIEGAFTSADALRKRLSR